jgi:type I restriction enzyme M protein
VILSKDHFTEFEECFDDDPNGKSLRKGIDRFKWTKDDSLDDPDDLGEPDEIITEAVTQLTLAIDELNQVLKLLEKPEE